MNNGSYELYDAEAALSRGEERIFAWETAWLFYAIMCLMGVKTSRDGKGAAMGHFGFSYIGLLFLLMLISPNLLWIRHQPKGYDAQNENRILVAFERLGQVLVTCTALVFADFNLRPWSLWALWLIAAVILMLLYEGWWIRYFTSQKTLKDFYGSFCRIPVAGAILPVAAFFLLGIYGRVVWMLISVAILGIGHIGIHLRHSKEIQ